MRKDSGEIRKEGRIDLEDIACSGTSSEIADGVLSEIGVEDERVIPGPTRQNVIASAAVQSIIAQATQQSVVAVERVVTVASVEGVIAGGGWGVARFECATPTT